MPEGGGGGGSGSFGLDTLKNNLLGAFSSWVLPKKKRELLPPCYSPSCSHRLTCTLHIVSTNDKEL